MASSLSSYLHPDIERAVQVDPVTGLELHPIPPELRSCVTGRWRKTFATAPQAVRYVEQVRHLEGENRRYQLSEEQERDLSYARHRIALSWLIATGRTQQMIGREEAEVAKVDLSGFWYRRGFHDCTHFVAWPWRRPPLSNQVLGWLTEGIRVARLLALLAWGVIGWLLFRLIFTAG